MQMALKTKQSSSGQRKTGVSVSVRSVADAYSFSTQSCYPRAGAKEEI
jgi:hypothetical protein